MKCRVSVYLYLYFVHVLENNYLRAHYTSAHGGVLANGLSDICLKKLNYNIELLEIMFDC